MTDEAQERKRAGKLTDSYAQSKLVERLQALERSIIALDAAVGLVQTHGARVARAAVGVPKAELEFVAATLETMEGAGFGSTTRTGRLLADVKERLANASAEIARVERRVTTAAREAARALAREDS